jgi:hypothetical protein
MSNIKYTKEEFLKAAEIGEVSEIDARHTCSLLNKAKKLMQDQRNKVKVIENRKK